MKNILISLWFLLLVIFAGAQEDVKVKVDAFDFKANGELYLYEGEYIISKESGDKEKLPHGNGKLTQPVLENEKMIKKGYCLTPYSYEGQWQFGKKHGRGEEKKYVKTVSNTSLVEHYVGDYKEDFYDGNGTLKTTNYNYTGEFKQGKKSGKGKIVLSNKDEYTGEWLNDVYHGQGVFTNNLSGERYEGEFINGLFSKGKYFYANGNTYDGEWNNNEPSGNGTYYWKQSGEEYVGEFKNGNPDGVGKLTKKDGTFYSGVIKDGKFTGEGNITNYTSNFTLSNSYEADEIAAIKGVYNGKIKDNLPYGQGEFKSNEITKYINLSGDSDIGKEYSLPKYTYNGEWLNGKKSGIGAVNIKENGDGEGISYLIETKYNGNFLNDLYDCEECTLTANSEIGQGIFTYTGGFKAGQLHGMGSYQGEYAGGDLTYVGNFRAGLYDGEGKETYSDMYGSSILDGTFRENFIISGSEERYGPEGKLIYRYDGSFNVGSKSGFGKIEYHNDILSIWDEWSKNKVKSYEGEWKDNMPNGEGTMIYKNGKTDKGKFRNGEYVKPFTAPSVKIGNQTWMSENLTVTVFRNGDPIPEAKTIDEWWFAASEGKPAFCYYNNDPNTAKKFGVLYNWYAVTDSRGLAPEGWVVPSYSDVQEMIEYLNQNVNSDLKTIEDKKNQGIDTYKLESEILGKYSKISNLGVYKIKSTSKNWDQPGNNSLGFNSEITPERFGNGEFVYDLTTIWSGAYYWTRSYSKNENWVGVTFEIRSSFYFSLEFESYYGMETGFSDKSTGHAVRLIKQQ